MKRKTQETLNSSLRLVVQSSVIVFGGIFLSKIFSYAYRIIIARQFGPEAYGVFSLALMALGWFVALASLGLPEGVLRYVALLRGKHETQKIRFLYKTIHTLLICASILFGVLLFLLAEPIALEIFHTSALTIYLRVFSLLVPLSVLSSLYLSLLRAYEKIGIYSFIINIFQTGIRVMLLLFLMIAGVAMNAILLSYLLATLLVFLFAYAAVHFSLKDLSTSKERQDNELKREVFSYSWPLLLLSVISIVFYWTDSFFIGYFKSVADVGFYNAAVPLALLLGFAPDLFMQLFFPLITREYSRKNAFLIHELSKQVGKWIFILNMPLLLIMMVFPGVLLNVFFGEEYLVAEHALRLLAVGAFFSSMLAVSSNLLSMIGKSRLILTNSVGALVLNIVLNILLIPRYGLEGAAAATMISYIVLSSVYLFQVKRIFSFVPLRRKMISIFLASLIPLIVILFVKQFFLITIIPLAIFGLLFFLLYAVLILVADCLDKHDMLIVKALRKKIFKQK